MRACDLRRLGDGDVARLYHAGDDTVRRACVAEMNRRDRADEARRRYAAVRDEWALAQHADYLAADVVCRGNLLSKAGRLAGVSEFSLWTGRADVAMRYASEELRDYWAANGGRLTVGGFARQRAAQEREARDMRVIERSTRDEQRNDAGAGVGEPATSGPGRVRAVDVVRAGRDGQQHGRAQARPVRHTGSVQRVAPAPVRPVSPRRPVLPVAPAVPGSGYTVTAGGRVLARGVRSLDLARAICEATPQAKALEGAGMPLQWSGDGNGFTAGSRVYAFTVTS